MAKNRDWVDYANLAANVVQTAELASINGKMRQMAELQMEKDDREQQAAAVERCEDILREAVFLYTEQLRDVEDIATRNSVEAHIRANYLKGTYERMPQFKASGFRKFEDKERLANVQRNCDRLIRDTAERIKPEQRESCAKCISHLLARDELVQLLSLQERAEALAREKESLPEKEAAKEAALKSIRAEQGQLKRPVAVTICQPVFVLSLGAIGVIVVGITLYLVLASEHDADRFAGNSFGQWVGVVVVLIVIAIASFGVVRSSPYTRKRDEFRKKALAIKAGFIAMRNSLPLREAEIGQTHSIGNKFGTVRAVDSQRLLQEGDALLTRMLGDTVRGLIRGKAAPADQSYDLVLLECPGNGLQVGMAIRASVFPNLAAKDAYTLIKALPCPLLEGVSRERAESARWALETAGAKAEVRPTATASDGMDRYSDINTTK